MTSICFYFQLHQPFRLNWFWPEKSAGWKGSLMDLYFDKGLNRFTFKKVAGKCYHKANDIILAQIDRFKNTPRQFKVSYSLSGTFLDQCERWDKDLLEKFRQMADSGCIEFLCETYYHSLSSLYEDKTEFTDQVKEHQQAMKDLLGQKSKIFRNTELLYHNDIASEVEKLGFEAIMTEGIERILDGWRSPNYVYKRSGGDIKVLLRNYPLSDDIGYRFSARWWEQYPLTADKYAAWLSSTPGDTINIFIDYETFGEHHWEDTGIFWFLGALPQEILKWQHLEFTTPSEVVSKYQPVGEINVPYYETVSWADLERDASAWIGNHMQQMALSEIKRLGPIVKQTGSDELLKIWHYLQTGDHFYYMCTKCLSDGDVHKYFSHHGNPYDAGLNYQAVLSDFKERILKHKYENSAQTPDKTNIEWQETPNFPKETPKPAITQVRQNIPALEKPPEQMQLLPARKNIQREYAPQEGEILIGAQKQKQSLPAESGVNSMLIPGRRLTPAEKYCNTEIIPKRTPLKTITPARKITPAEKYTGDPAAGNVKTQSTLSAASAPKNTQILKGKKITPMEKYAPKSSRT
jgi:alpha-amylase